MNQKEASADSLIARLTNASLSCSKGQRGDIHHEAARLIEHQAAQIATLQRIAHLARQHEGHDPRIRAALADHEGQRQA